MRAAVKHKYVKMLGVFVIKALKVEQVSKTFLWLQCGGMVIRLQQYDLMFLRFDKSHVLLVLNLSREI